MNLEAKIAEMVRLALSHAEHPGMCESDESQEPRRSAAVARYLVSEFGLGLTVEHGKQQGQIVERCAWGNLTRYVSRWERRDVVV